MSDKQQRRFRGVFVGLGVLVSACSEFASTPEVPYTPLPRIQRPLLEMALVPTGEFTMGSPVGEGTDNERPQRLVRFASPFAISVYEVTRGQYREVLGRGREQDPDLPATLMTWYDAIEFCNELSIREGLEPAYELDAVERASDDGSIERARVERTGASGYRLPSEAEWEYACRAGTTTPWSCGSNPEALFEHGWFKDHAKTRLQPVGALEPNPWGLHDMHGNAWEWVEDAFEVGYEGAPTDGTVWNEQGISGRCLRGGGYLAGADSCRSAYRNRGIPFIRGGAFGFRVVLEEGPVGSVVAEGEADSSEPAAGEISDGEPVTESPPPGG